MLLAIAKRTSIGNHTNTKQIIAVGHFEMEVDSSISSCFYQEFLTLSSNNFLRHRVEQCEYCCSFHRFTRQIGYCSGYQCFISNADKPRHIRSQHKLLGSYNGSIQHPSQHILSM